MLMIPAALLALAACEESPLEPVSAVCDPILTTFAQVSGDTVATVQNGGYIELQVGNGNRAAVGSNVDVHYTLYDLSGGPIQTTCGGPNTTLLFRLGDGALLQGFELGVVGMQVGGVRRIVFPAPANYPVGDERLVFDVELVSVR